MEHTLLLRFNQALTAMSAEDFVQRVLVERLAAREVWVGSDFRFGHKRGGDVALLERMGAQLGFSACTMPAIQLDGSRVSASRVRALLAAGAEQRCARIRSAEHTSELQSLMRISYAVFCLQKTT